MALSMGGRSLLRIRRTVAPLVAAALMISACGSAAQPSSSSLGIRAGSGFFNGETFVEAEQWLGREIAWTVQFTGRQTPQDMNGSAFGLLAEDGADLPEFADRLSLSITVPLGFGTMNARTRPGRDAIADNLEAVTAGDFDEAYRRLASRLVEAGYADAVVRLGHEFNGAWAPWSSRTNEELFVAAWQHVHGVLRGESADFVFDWTATRPAWVEWGRAAYPGDEFVDIVGLDVYWRVQEGADAWDSEIWERDYLRVMRDHVAFAELHGKPVSYPEWGLSGSDAPEFIEAMHVWLTDLDREGPVDLEYHSFFNSGEEFTLAQFPLAKEAYQDLFG